MISDQDKRHGAGYRIVTIRLMNISAMKIDQSNLEVLMRYSLDSKKDQDYCSASIWDSHL